MALKEQYGDFDITYKENCDMWTGSLDGKPIATSEKLSDLKKRLDKHGQAEKAFTRVKVFWKEHSEGWVEGEVTSVTPEGEAWITESGKGKARHKRANYYLKMTYLQTEENMQRRQQWDALEKEVVALQEQQGATLKAMTVFAIAKVAE